MARWLPNASDTLYATFGEPPWSYDVEASQVVLDVMGTIRTLDLRTGRSTSWQV
jgi:hypothetical protein